MDRTVVGTVGYLNAEPLTAKLDPERFEVVARHPRGIAAALASGEVDVALAPVAAVLADGDFRVLGGLCVGADGPVGSVVIAAESPPEEWTKVVLDGSSRTSVILAQLLLRDGPLSQRVRPDLQIVQGEVGDGPRLVGGSVAAVVIGDPARALPTHLIKHDLAQMWTEWTGRPFVFAVWAGRENLPGTVRDALVAAGHEGVDSVAERFSGEQLTYLTEFIRYPLDEPALMGLREFAARAHRAGLLPTELVQFYPPALRKIEGGASAPSKLGREDALALWRRASPELAMRAHARRCEAFDGGRVSYAPDADEAEVLDARDGAAFVHRLFELAAREDLPGVEVALEVADGAGVSPDEPTHATWLRAVALARLVLPETVHVSASPSTRGLGSCQAALVGGADDLGRVPEGEGEEAERLIRALGAEPWRRDAAYASVGEAAYRPRRVRPVEARAKRS